MYKHQTTAGRGLANFLLQELSFMSLVILDLGAGNITIEWLVMNTAAVLNVSVLLA